VIPSPAETPPWRPRLGELCESESVRRTPPYRRERRSRSGKSGAAFRSSAAYQASGLLNIGAMSAFLRACPRGWLAGRPARASMAEMVLSMTMS
jgi:hypothetical protein